MLYNDTTTGQSTGFTSVAAAYAGSTSFVEVP